MRSFHSVLVLLLAGAAAACGARDAAEEQQAGAAPAGVVDSALPIPVLLDRFRATLPDTPRMLAGGESSINRLARRLLIAVERNDTATARALILTRSEFAWLYYPETKFTHPPYELGPELVWLTTIGASEKGIGRLFARYGARRLRVSTIACPDSAVAEGVNRVHRGCRVTFSVPDSSAREMQLFGAVLERDGRFKFLSYANDL